jgi:thiosulfate reductase cytochrome b subunit
MNGEQIHRTMEGAEYLSWAGSDGPGTSHALRHSALVRVTHWITALSFVGLVVSGIAILLAHPRLYWGETGAVGTPSLIDLPLPFMLTGQSGWGRYLHFLSAWVSVAVGFVYVCSGFQTRHFRRHLWPEPSDVNWSAIVLVVSNHLHRHAIGQERSRYNVLQQLTYSAVVFVLFPMMVWTGLAMSPAVTSVFPLLVTLLGGQQSARTVHFFVASSLVVFLFVHVALVCMLDGTARLRAMLTGRGPATSTPV